MIVLRMGLEAEISQILEIFTFTSITFLNFATLSFVIQFKTVKNSVRQATRKFNTKMVTIKSSYSSSFMLHAYALHQV